MHFIPNLFNTNLLSIIIMIYMHLRFLSFAVQAYNICTIGLDDEYKNIFSLSLKLVTGVSHFCSIQSLEELDSISEGSLDAIISFSENSLIKKKIEIYSAQHKLPCLSLSSGKSQNFTFYSDHSKECYARSISSIVNYFSLANPTILWTFTEENLKIIESLIQDSNFEFSQLSFLDNLSSSEVSSILNKISKPKGIKNFIFLQDSNLCKVLVEAFISSYLVKKGNVAVFLSNCIYQVDMNGSLILSYEGFENVSNSEEFKMLNLLKFLNPFSIPGLSNNQLLNQLNKIYDNDCRFSLVNIQQGQRKFIGTVIKGKVSIEAPIEFLGGAKDLKSFTSSAITISANTGSFNPLSQDRAYSNEGYQQGTYFAVDKINRDLKLFPYHKFELYDSVNCGVSIFDFEYAKKCFFDIRPEMGVAHIPTAFPFTLSALKLLDYYNLSIPFVGGIGSSGLLSNKSEYPYFVRTVSPSTDWAVAWANLIRLYGWNEIVVHYSNDGYAGSAYKVLDEMQKTHGFKFVNDEKYRQVEYIYSYEDLAPYYSHIKNSMSLGCNIIFLILGEPAGYFWLEGFYDLGARRGDFTFLLFADNGLSNFDADNANVKKRKELMHGTLIINNGAWVGEYGAEVKQEFLRFYNDSWGKSYFIDAVYAAAITTEFLMTQGHAFEEPVVFMQALRNIRFLGTTGVISFDSGTNNRNINYFNVFNFYEDENKTWHDDAVALIAPLGSVYFTVLKQTVWSNGKFPQSRKEYYLNCSFFQDQVIDSSSNLIEYCLISAIFLLSCIITFILIKFSKIEKLKMIEKKVMIDSRDYLALSFILIETLQIASIGPSFSSFNKILSDITHLVTIDFFKQEDLARVAFWGLFFTITLITCLWILLNLMTFIKPLKQSSNLMQIIDKSKALSIPIMTNYLFIPVIVSLISIIKCDKAIGNKYTESFLNFDCTLFCWKGDHITFTVLSCLLIIAFISLSIFHVIMCNNQISNHIKSCRVYFIICKKFEVLMILLSKVFKEYNKLLFCFIFISLLFLLLIIAIIIKRPYNYDRANLWCKLMLVCLIWNSTVCLCEILFIRSKPLLIVIQFIGWLVIIVIGLCMHKRLPENLLISQKGRSVVELFRFGFGIQSFKSSFYIIRNSEIMTDNHLGIN